MIVAEKSSKGSLVTDHLYRHVVDISDELYLIMDGVTHLTRGPEDLQLMGYVN